MKLFLKHLPWALILSALLLLAGSSLQVHLGQSSRVETSDHTLGTDDAYIAFRYARNLAEGHGLVFNPGERVEGYSCLLFVLLCAGLVQLVGAEALYAAVSWISVTCLLGALLLFHRIVRIRLGPGAAAVAALLFAACPALWFWTSSGMETVVVFSAHVLLWLTVVLFDEDESDARLIAVILVSSLCVLLRADGFLLPALTVGYFLANRRFRPAVLTLLGVAPVFVALVGWRLLYYGYPLPNTYYAKVSGPLGERLIHGASQLASLAIELGLLPFLLAILFAALSAFWAVGSEAKHRFRFEVVLPLGMVAYFLYVGGDHFGERFLLMAYPMGIYTILRWLAPTDTPRARRVAPRLAFVSVILVAWQFADVIRHPDRFRVDRYDSWITLGRFLNSNAPGRVLATGAAGKIPYFSELNTIDMRGLTNEFIGHLEIDRFIEPGHNKLAPRWVLAQEPDLIAAWIRPNLDLAAGMRRHLYRPAGYEVRWLVNTRRESAPENVIDVRGASLPDIQSAMQRGYEYAVLERQSD